MTTDDHVSMDTRSKDILRIQEPSGWHVVSKCTAFILWINDLHTWFFLSSVLNKSLPSWKRLCIVSSSMGESYDFHFSANLLFFIWL